MKKIELVVIGLLLSIVLVIAGCTSTSPPKQSGYYKVTSNGSTPGYAIVPMPTNTQNVTIFYDVNSTSDRKSQNSIVALTTVKIVPKNNQEADPSNLISYLVDSKGLIIGSVMGNNNGEFGNVTLKAQGAKSLVIETTGAKGTFNVTTS
jgi:hypothetical protein